MGSQQSRKQVVQDLKAAFGADELLEIVADLRAHVVGEVILSEEQWGELEVSDAAIGRGEGIAVDDIEGFLESLAPHS